ncbi:MAG: prepilin-type N-terminal cleavage/methylation domain-containing protein [Rhodospirillaceae bacterium]|nr:prepilin-type N-terminal cleavage/methylation domain-containing protein [Rhodospirillaceae bacterium]
MINLNTARERGFTLIEMSIVLIIIGLIIGGILKGQELIESARQKNYISQTDSVKAGVNSFIDRFRAFPGDYGSSAVCAVCVSGNGDGILQAAAANAGAIAAINGVTGENYEFWNMLVGAGFIGGGSSSPVATGALGFSGGTVISPLPQAAFPQSGLTVAYGTHQGGASSAGSLLANWIRAHKFASNGQVADAQAIVAPVRALQLDTKYDDAQPQTGRIRTSGLDTTNCGTAGTGGAYTALTSVECDLVMALE